jgi:hypothetical protein
MSIDRSKVRAVLLADGWHYVRGESFWLNEYDYVMDKEGVTSTLLHEAGENGVCAIGFDFIEEVMDPESGDVVVRVVSGPLTSILAVQEENDQNEVVDVYLSLKEPKEA